MPIQHLLYRCPRCGHDPMTAISRRARCDSCGTIFEQGRAGAIIVRSADGNVEEASVDALIDAIDRFGSEDSVGDPVGGDPVGEDPVGEAPVGEAPVGEAFHEAHVTVGCGNRHEAVWWKNRVLGFFERITDRRDGVLRLDGSGVTLTSPGRQPLVWNLESISAIQISSKAIQLNIRDTGLQQMEFRSDSPKRWDDLLKAALSRFYGARGLEVVEFQPRVVTRRKP